MGITNVRNEKDCVYDMPIKNCSIVQELADLKAEHELISKDASEYWEDVKKFKGKYEALKQLVGKYDEWQRCDWTGRSNKSLTERQELWQKIMQAIGGE